MSLKLFYLTTEISPFANTSPLGDFSVKIPLALQNAGHDIRTILPKYGFVSERKYILREVIRLREIPFEFEGVELKASAKSAFIPKTRVQVYFLEDDKWFKPLTTLLYKSKNGRVLSDNDLRFSFYSKAALATLPHLFWSPDILICNSWQTTFTSIIYKQLYQNEKFYKGIKTTQVIHHVDDYANFSRESFEKAGIDLPKELKGDTINGYEASAYFTDQIIVFNKPGEDNLAKIMKLPGVKKNQDKIVSLEWSDPITPDYDALSSKIEEALLKLSES